jgi:broad specificity phosphatase PhoE
VIEAPVAARRTRVYLVRHGETDWNALGRLQGIVDVPLNARGLAQARALASRLRDVRLDAAYCSALGRARRTAAIVLAGRGVTAVEEPALNEMSYGRWQGSTRAQLAGDDPELAARWDADPWAVTFPGGESLVDVHRRAVAAWQRLVAAHEGETVLVSAHGHVNRVLLVHALSLPRDHFWRIAQPNGECRVLDCDGAGVAAARPPPAPA